MGRKKISINFIEDSRLRAITNAKRKRGLIKKAMELSLLCGTNVFLVIHDKSAKRAVVYSNFIEEDKAIFTDQFIKNKTVCRYNKDDVSSYIN